MVGQFGFGRAGRSHDTGYMVTGQVTGFQPPRWQRPGQVVHQFVVDKADGLNWLPETDRSVAATALRSVVAAGDTAKAAELLPVTLGIIDKIAQKKVIHANTASRYKSRLAQKVAALGK